LQRWQAIEISPEVALQNSRGVGKLKRFERVTMRRQNTDESFN
jgi:hypothetical protein